MNNTNANSGTKIHLKDYTGVKRTVSGKIIVNKRINAMGPQMTACRISKDAETFIRFHEIVKSNPESVCKKCRKKYDEVVKEYRNMIKKG